MIRRLPWQLYTHEHNLCHLHTHLHAYIHMTHIVDDDVITLHFPPPSLSSPVVDTTPDHSQNGRSNPLA